MSNGALLSGKNFGIGGVTLAAVTLAWTTIDTARQEARTALQVQAQHGDEFNAIRADIRELVSEHARLRAQLDLGGRFTREDGDRMDARIERLMGRVERMERHIAQPHVSPEE